MKSLFLWSKNFTDIMIERFPQNCVLHWKKNELHENSLLKKVKKKKKKKKALNFHK